jgi:hypothetical protein
MASEALGSCAIAIISDREITIIRVANRKLLGITVPVSS